MGNPLSQVSIWYCLMQYSPLGNVHESTHCQALKSSCQASSSFWQKGPLPILMIYCQTINWSSNFAASQPNNLFKVKHWHLALLQDQGPLIQVSATMAAPPPPSFYKWVWPSCYCQGGSMASWPGVVSWPLILVHKSLYQEPLKQQSRSPP